VDDDSPGRAASPTRAQYFVRWSELHGGYDPSQSRLTGGWLSIVYVVAAPFVRLRVPPDLVTVLGAVVSGVVAWLAALGGRWLLAAAAVVVLSGLIDNLDGAVAVMTDRVTRWGYVLDSVVDRISDALYLLALWLAGAPAGVCVGAGVLMGLQEYARARAGAAGMDEVGVVTVAERPTRVIVTAMFLLGAGWYVDASASWATWGAWAWVGLGAVGLLQLLVVVRRRLS
jgi:CDP-diacylglycerol--glycerol-3-phosphate 3-phosphatidyltransferase